MYAHLADGEFHSGEELARELGLTRSAIWKATASLRALGTGLEAVRNRGYRLTHPGELLDAAKIRGQLPRAVRERLHAIETAWSIPSTNTELLGRPFPRAGTGEVLLAEYQTAGKGRRGRSWMAPPGGAICLSLSWTFPTVSQDLGALGLVIGVCALRALRALGLEGAELKWPNDLLLHSRKLGGVLIELRAEASGPACVVIGIGLNVALGVDLLTQIEATGIAATDLHHAGLRHHATPRSRLLGAFVRAAGIRQAALKPFLAEWRDVHSRAARERHRRRRYQPGAGARHRRTRCPAGGDGAGHPALHFRRCHREARVMAVIWVDIGITRIKWSRADGARPGATHAAVHARWKAADYARRLLGRGVTRLLVASVADPGTNRMLARAARSAGVTVEFATVPRRAAGITVGYAEPGAWAWTALPAWSAHHLSRACRCSPWASVRR